jgi:polysaccharide export outer membrane protein
MRPGIPTLLAGPLLSAALLLPHAAHGQGTAQLPAVPAAAALAEATAGADEAVRPGDVVRLTVWRHPDLTDEFPVNQYGTVVLPKLGEIDVSRETHRSLRTRVIDALKETVVSPSIEVVVLKRVRVLGEVQKPSVLFLDPTMSVADALALAGGTTSQGRQGAVILRRDGTALFANLRVDTRLSDAQIRSGDELVVPQRNWFDRNSGPLIGSSVGFIGILVALLTR